MEFNTTSRIILALAALAALSMMAYSACGDEYLAPVPQRPEMDYSINCSPMDYSINCTPRGGTVDCVAAGT
jgi:hypothetical protein